MTSPASSPALHLFGVTLIGATPENGVKLALTVAWVLGVTALNRGLRWLALKVAPKRFAFWVRQAISILGAAALILGALSIWFNDPRQVATAMGLVTAGVAFALQRVITAVAGYLVILRGTTFNVGDRIVMGGVRGDVIALNFMQTTILEMGQTEAEQGDKPSMWVHSRQYTGRVVTVTNAKVFDEPIYNYSKDLPYFWDEFRIPVPYGSDHKRAEQILLDAAARHTADVRKLSEEQRKELSRRYDLPALQIDPKVYLRLTDNWVELTLRFFVADHGARERKDAMSREILEAMQAAGLQVASGTYAIVQVPKLQVALEAAPGAREPGKRP
jgi:small-conductance mechanosensitive channel